MSTKTNTASEAFPPIASSALQLYPGYQPQDVSLVQSLLVGSATPLANGYIDGFGVKTLHACVPFADSKSLDFGRLSLPFPDDGFHAEAIEYVAMADSITRASKTESSLSKSSFCAVEIGAGWGPWMAACGVIARRLGFEAIQLVGVEASTQRFDLMRQHLLANQLPAPTSAAGDIREGEISVRLFNGAVWVSDGNIWFPESEVTDMGSAAAEQAARVDYRGTRARHRAVPCQRLETLLSDISRVDFMHIDIQGAEFDVVNCSIDWLGDHVACLMAATHSRVIEGRLIDLMFKKGWELYREKPCQVNWTKTGDLDLTGRTWIDGGQYWLNTALVSFAEGAV